MARSPKTTRLSAPATLDAAPSAPDTRAGDGAGADAKHAARADARADTEQADAPTYAIVDDVVLDVLRGLEWQPGVHPPTLWSEAAQKCAELRLAGHADWRLPTRAELVSLLDPASRPTIDTLAFPNSVADYHWSGTRVHGTDDRAFTVYFAEATVEPALIQSAALVRCVRRPTVSAAAYEVSADVVRDDAVKLAWQRSVQGEVAEEDAVAVCERLYGPRWRLPTLQELVRLVDDKRADPAIDPAAFAGTPAAAFWAFVPGALPGTAFRLVDFKRGGILGIGVRNKAFVRCVARAADS